jgi:D-arabinose 1-dehydrogenase-like Zn-dependent alcohol dehydrogenase
MSLDGRSANLERLTGCPRAEYLLGYHYLAAGMEIRAYAIQQRGEAATPFVYHKTLGPHDVLVRITHRSITRGDLQFIDNDWGDTRFPLVPSHEMVGSAEQTGRAVTDLTRGDRVGVGFQLGACFECSFCRQGVEQFWQV